MRPESLCNQYWRGVVPSSIGSPASDNPVEEDFDPDPGIKSLRRLAGFTAQGPHSHCLGRSSTEITGADAKASNSSPAEPRMRPLCKRAATLLHRSIALNCSADAVLRVRRLHWP